MDNEFTPQKQRVVEALLAIAYDADDGGIVLTPKMMEDAVNSDVASRTVTVTGAMASMVIILAYRMVDDPGLLDNLRLLASPEEPADAN